MKRILLIVCGSISLALGAVGVIIPVLPTTPFVLLAAGCFSASSPKAYRFLLRSRFFGPYIEHYRNGGGISKAAKARGIIVLWVLLTVSGIVVGKLWLVPVLAAVGIGVTLHLLLIKTKADTPQPGSGLPNGNRADSD
jgi:uncharacterized membrane protein YbaN (DUF454 family)